ncbi:hypothetical protein [uncultured Roseibium sp.]|uniref:hypothetical protein n=1 Tax=uncultured Roseibium sp. TaxID=1936171 RepID=UPI0032163A6A
MSKPGDMGCNLVPNGLSIVFSVPCLAENADSKRSQILETRHLAQKAEAADTLPMNEIGGLASDLEQTVASEKI